MTPIGTDARLAKWLESAWLARYLERQLSAEEASWFEAYVLDKPELVEAIEMDADLRDAMATTETDAAVSERPHSAASAEEPPLIVDRRVRSREWSALAATLILGLVGGWLGQRMFVSERDFSSTIANPVRITFDTMRGEPVPPRVEHAESASEFVIVEVAVQDEASDVALLLGGERPIALTPSREGFVSALIPRRTADNLREGVLRYRLNGIPIEQSLAFPNLGGH